MCVSKPLYLLNIICREMSVLLNVCLCVLTLEVMTLLVTHGSPVSGNQGSFSSDVIKKRLARREHTHNVPKVIVTRADESKFHSKKSNADDSISKITDSRSFRKPVGPLDKPSTPEEMSERDLLERTNINHRKRILDVITGEECGAFGCEDDNTNDGEFPYGSDDDTDYSRPHQDNEGYWVECAEDPTLQCYYDGSFPPGHWSRCEDGPRGWCYYYDEDAIRGYWQECEDDPNYDCYYYNDDTHDALGFWEDCEDNQNFECYYYYDTIWISNG